MHIRRSALAVALTVTAVLASRAGAADQTVLGKTLLVKDPKPNVDASKRGVGVLGKESASSDTLMGNPVANGATVEIIANGTTPSDQVFTLPAGAAGPGTPGWKALGKPVNGYSYKDAAGVNGPVKTALIKKSGSGTKSGGGTFLVMVNLNGALGPGPQPHITVVPPAPGTDGGMRFTINGGDSYCVAFGSAAGGKVINAPAKGTPNKLFKIVGPTSEGCPTVASATTTTTMSSTTMSSTTTSSTTATSTTATSTTATSTTTTSITTTTSTTTTSTTTTSTTATSTTTSSTTTTSTTTSTTTTTCPSTPPSVRGALPATVGRFNFNAQLGLPGANAACNTNFACSQACTRQQLQAAPTSELAGLKDINTTTVTSFWAIDSTAPILQQCNDDAVGGSGLNWEYGTAHTASRGQQMTLNNSTGVLGPVVGGIQCNIAGTSWVGCCQ